jgi:hypothetical protein
LRSQPTPKGAPFYNAISPIDEFTSELFVREVLLPRRKLCHNANFWRASKVVQ